MANKSPNYPPNELKGDTTAYHVLHSPAKPRVKADEVVRPFAEIDRLLAWYYNPKHSFR